MMEESLFQLNKINDDGWEKLDFICEQLRPHFHDVVWDEAAKKLLSDKVMGKIRRLRREMMEDGELQKTASGFQVTDRRDGGELDDEAQDLVERFRVAERDVRSKVLRQLIMKTSLVEVTEICVVLSQRISQMV